MDKKVHQQCLVSILFLTAFIRILAAVYWQIDVRESGQEFGFGDSDSYWTISKVFYEDGELAYGTGGSKMFRAPLYPILLSPIHFVFSGPVAVFFARVIGVLLSLLLVWLLMKITNQLAGSLAGLFAGLFYCFYPGAIGMSIFVLSESLFCPLMIVSLWCIQVALARELRIRGISDWLRFGVSQQASIEIVSAETSGKQSNVDAQSKIKPVWPFWLFAGIASGLACLSRPSWLLWCGCLAMLLVITRYGLAKTVTRFAIFLAGLALAMSPWWVRNYKTAEKFVPTTLQVGASLYDSFHEGSDGSSKANMAFMKVFEKQQLTEDAKNGPNLESTFEWRLDQRVRRAAWARIKENPSDVFRLGLLKFARTWSPFPLGRTVQNVWVARSEALGYLGILAFAVAAFVIQRSSINSNSVVSVWERLRFLCLWISPAIYFAALHSFFVGSIRYRHPPMVAMTVVAGIGCVLVLQAMKRTMFRANRKSTELDRTSES